MVANQNIEISKKGYAAFDKGDVETVLSDYDDSVEFVVPATSSSTPSSVSRRRIA